MKQQAFDFKHELGWDFEDILLRNYLTHTKQKLQPYSKLKQFAKIQFLNDKKKIAQNTNLIQFSKKFMVKRYKMISTLNLKGKIFNRKKY